MFIYSQPLAKPLHTHPHSHPMGSRLQHPGSFSDGKSKTGQILGVNRRIQSEFSGIRTEVDLFLGSCRGFGKPPVYKGTDTEIHMCIGPAEDTVCPSLHPQLGSLPQLYSKGPGISREGTVIQNSFCRHHSPSPQRAGTSPAAANLLLQVFCMLFGKPQIRVATCSSTSRPGSF